MKSFPLWWTVDGVCACPEGNDCNSPGKHPLTRNGGKDATDDAEALAMWGDQHPLAHWGTATGAVSGVVVVDLDRKPGKNGVAEFGALASKNGGLPRTYTVRTGSGGLHLYFAHPGGVVKNSQSKIGPGIDVRGDGGYVVAPPSGHVSGGVYEVAIDAPIATLPAWLLAEMTATPAPKMAPGQSSTERGFFPLATPALLEAARQHLERMGPAIEGSGGDAHTFQVGAVLMHDFALTEDEAWPLLAEWNDTCQPPWDENALAAKMRGGEKYASGAYGARRPQDHVEAAQKLINDWQNGDRNQAAMFALVEQCRDHARNCGDKVKRAVIERDLEAATGMGPKALNLPPAVVPFVETPGSIAVTVEIAKVADLATAAIAPAVFQRNGVLCEVVKAERTFLHDLEPSSIQDLMSRHSKFTRPDKEQGSVTTAPPLAIAVIIAGRRTHEKIRVIEAITTAPIFLADGSILQERGYNAAARVFLEPSVSVCVPDLPGIEDARAAVEVFRDLLCDFDFATPADFGSWMAGLLSPLVKSATGNATSPLICVSASTAGAGKTLLTDVIARIITGGPAEVRPYNAKDPSEWGKRLTAFVKAASPVSVFDNINGPVGDEGLDRLITSSTWSDRILGASEAPPLPNVTTWFATGNNIEPVGDTVRRSLVVRIDVSTERPQERTGFRYPLLAEHVSGHRSELLSAALTILRAYHCEGRPVQALPSWGSFTPWSDLVRGALVWAGVADPFLTQRRATANLNEPENEAHDFWIGVLDTGEPSTAGQIVVRANALNACEVLGTRDQMTAHTLRRFLGRFIDKPRAGRRIRRVIDSSKNQTQYYVEVIT